MQQARGAEARRKQQASASAASSSSQCIRNRSTRVSDSSSSSCLILLLLCSLFAASEGFLSPALPLRPACSARTAALPTFARSSRLSASSSVSMVQGDSLVKRIKEKAGKFIATAAIAATLCVMPKGSSAALADLELQGDLDEDVEQVEIEYTGMRKLSLGENVVKYSILVGVFGGAAVWSYYEGKREDREEEERVKAEVERIEKWKKEFIDMEDVVSDDDLLSSLNKRLSGEAGEDVKDLDGTGALPEGYDPEKAIIQDQMRKMEEEMEKERLRKEQEQEAALKDIQVEEDKPAQVDAEQLERLKRMFGGGDSSADKKDK
eukprot:548998-Hanusia_phi.AAC.8